MRLGSSRLAARQELSETRAAAIGVPELYCVPSCVRECGARMWGFKCMRESRALVIVHSVTPQPSHGHRTILLLPHTSHTNKDTLCVCVCGRRRQNSERRTKWCDAVAEVRAWCSASYCSSRDLLPSKAAITISSAWIKVQALRASRRHTTNWPGSTILIKWFIQQLVQKLRRNSKKLRKPIVRS